MEYKVHKYRYDNFHKFEDIIKQSLDYLGYSDSDISNVKHIPAVNVYNHCHISEVSNPNRPIVGHSLIFKPTAPTSKHFAIDTLGYANASTLAYEKPDINPDIEQMDWASIVELRNTKPNKWDDSILLKWHQARVNIPEDHILIIGQQPHDETVNGFGFGDHWKKLTQIVDGLKDGPIVIKLHPAMDREIQMRAKQIEKWISQGITVITDYVSIHTVLPRTRVAIVENSTAGIECLMHEVPVISYGWPEYHWATLKAQTIPQINSATTDLDWYQPVYAKQFIEWYINHYLCTDINSTVRRLKEILWT